MRSSSDPRPSIIRAMTSFFHLPRPSTGTLASTKASSTGRHDDVPHPFQLLRTAQTVWYYWIMKTISSFRLIFCCLALCPGPTSGIAGAAADPIEDVKQEQTKTRHEEQIKELRRQEQIENLKRDQQLNQAQQHLDQLKQQNPDAAGAQQPQLRQTQQQLDQLKNEQQIKRLQSELQINQIQREQNEQRQQEQIRELQRQQQMEFLQEQNRKNQMQLDLDRLRQK